MLTINTTYLVEILELVLNYKEIIQSLKVD
jgi:hypothetical protein